MTSLVSSKTLKLRLCAIEIEAMAALATPISALVFPRWNARSEAFPYFINRINRVSAQEGSDDEGEERSVYVLSVVSRLVIAHLTADYGGEAGDALDDQLMQIIEYVDAREKLQSAAYPTQMSYLSRFSFTDGTGFMEFPPSPGGVQQMGAEFLWRAEFDKALSQDYEG